MNLSKKIPKNLKLISTIICPKIDNILSSVPSYLTGKTIYEKVNYNKILKFLFLEFMEFLEKNKNFLKEELFENEHFVSGLIITYSEIMKQRFEWKRQRIFGIFLDFINQEDKENFELERTFNVLNLISLEDLKIFMLILKKEEYINLRILVISNNSELMTCNYLTSLGIIVNEDKSEFKFMKDTLGMSEKFFTTNFGNYFVKLIIAG